MIVPTYDSYEKELSETSDECYLYFILLFFLSSFSGLPWTVLLLLSFLLQSNHQHGYIISQNNLHSLQQNHAVTYICQGCSKQFCFDQLTEHRTNIRQQFDHLQNDHDQLREQINDLKNDPTKLPFLRQINQWEEDSLSTKLSSKQSNVEQHGFLIQRYSFDNWTRN